MATKVLIIAGGLTHERDVSVRSGRRVANILTQCGYEVRISDVDAHLAEAIETFSPDVVWPLVHGSIGEDGSLQSFLESVGIPGTEIGVSLETRAWFTPFWMAFIGLGLNEGAYLAEIIRAGILSVDHGQWEAATALGMNRGKIFRRIILPQAMRVIVPPIGNETISMLKTTSLVSAIPYTLELTFVANQKGQELFQPVPLLIAAAIWYLIVTSILMRIQSRIERHFGKGFDSTSPGDTTFIEVTP